MPPYFSTSHMHDYYLDNGQLVRGRPLPPVPTCQQPGEVPLGGSSELSALQRRDPSIVSTFDWCDGVRCVLDGDQGEKQSFEGRMIIYERGVYPPYGFCILDKGTVVHIQHLYPEDDISDHSNGLKIKSYPDFTAQRLSLTRSSSTAVVYKFSDIYRISGLESLRESSKGIPRILELSAVAEDTMVGVLRRLHSYIRMNKPYQPLLGFIHVYSPSPDTLPSPSPSPFSPPLAHPGFETPLTSAASSRSSSTVPLCSPRPIRCSQNYRDTVLLNPYVNSSFVPSAEVPAVASRSDLPQCPEIRDIIWRSDQNPFACGGFSDVFKGQMQMPSGDIISVAIKVLRLQGSNDDKDELTKLDTRLDRETKICNTLRHPNVLPFLGISRQFGPFPALISPYCPSRDVVHYLKHHSHVDRKPIALGLTSGLRYLHSQNVIHGDLKGSNVLIDPNGEPLICDFGVSRIIDCRGFTTRPVGTLPFMAPELFPDVYMVLDEDAVDNDVSPFCPEVTKETDVYAYALVLLQVLIGEDPKPHNGYFVAQKALLLPKRRFYSPMSDQLWDLVETCCHLDPKKRPTMEEVWRDIPWTC